MLAVSGNLLDEDYRMIHGALNPMVVSERMGITQRNGPGVRKIGHSQRLANLRKLVENFNKIEWETKKSDPKARLSCPNSFLDCVSEYVSRGHLHYDFVPEGSIF